MSPVRSWSERRKEAAEAPTGFKPLDPAVYNFVIKEPANVRISQNSGKSSWSVKAIVEDGERANAMIFHDFYDSDKPKGVAYLLEQFSALGLDDLIDTEPSDEAIAQALLGRRFSAEVYNDTYNGKVRQKLRNLRAPSGPPSVGPGGPVGGVVTSGPGAGPAPSQIQPLQQAQPPQFQQQAPVQQQAPQQYQQPVQQYAQPIAQTQQAPQQVQQPVGQQPAPDANPWATGGGTPLPQF